MYGPEERQPAECSLLLLILSSRLRSILSGIFLIAPVDFVGCCAVRVDVDDESVEEEVDDFMICPEGADDGLLSVKL